MKNLYKFCLSIFLVLPSIAFAIRDPYDDCYYNFRYECIVPNLLFYSKIILAVLSVIILLIIIISLIIYLLRKLRKDIVGAASIKRILKWLIILFVIIIFLYFLRNYLVQSIIY